MGDKIEITNQTNRVLDFPVGVKDGAVVTDDIGPGETKEIEISRDDPYLRGLVGAMAITVKPPTAAPELKAAQENAKAGTAPAAGTDKDAKKS